MLLTENTITAGGCLLNQFLKLNRIMKLNSKLIKALTSAQIVLLAVMLLALNLVMLFYPQASWLHMAAGSIFIIAILVIVISSGFSNEENIIGRK